MEGDRIAVALGDCVIISWWKSKRFYGDRLLTEGQFVFARMRPGLCTVCAKVGHSCLVFSGTPVCVCVFEHYCPI